MEWSAWKTACCVGSLAVPLGCGVEHTATYKLGSSSAAPDVEATSLLGEPLTRPQLDEEFRREQEALLAAAQEEARARPDSVEALVWVGRRTAYLGRYREAIDLYTEAIRKHPEEAVLYRHRGHRYLTVRELSLAAADLEVAVQLIEGTEDEIEPDGLPNERGIPTSTLHSNVWYHLGLVRYLQGDFEKALEAYRACLEVSKNPDMLVATTYWLNLTLRRLGRAEEAAAVLEPITADMDIIENQAYYRLLRMAQGHESPEALLEEATAAGGEVLSSTLAYGAGAWYLTQGETEKAEEVFRGILAPGARWEAFGYLAAEAEVGPGDPVDLEH